MLVAYLNNGTTIKRKIALVEIYKYPNCIKYTRITYIKEDCWERNLKYILQKISNRIRVKKKQRITWLPIQLNKHFN